METLTVSADNIRSQRGLDLAEQKGARIKHVTGETYLCPSQSSGAGYLVDVGAGTCTCDDFETQGERCKHQWAVLIVRGAVKVDGPRLRAGEPRKTYTQNWPAYNRAQMEEKARTQVLLRGLCDGIVQPSVPRKRGNQPLALADLVYGATMKVYATVSGRRATSDIRECERDGFLGHAPAHNSIAKFLDDPMMKPLLTQLVEESATPLRAIESAFAADATGFATSTYACWFDHKYGQDKRVQRWVKAHAMTGTKTHVITTLTVTEGHENDCPQFTTLLSATKAKGFDMREVSADKAYLSNENLAAIEATGAAAYIPFKTNSSPTGNTEAWQRLFHLFSLHRREWLDRYHLRSNSETVFSSVKRKFGGAVRSKLAAAQENEVLLKCLCHNLSMLVHAIHEFGVEPEFWMPDSPPSAVALSTEVAS